jgi:electron transport complex protein RnfE
MAENKESLGQDFTKGLIKDNPVLRLVLGTCPTLAISTSVENALGMGIAATLVLICSNAVISALRKVIPSKVRIPCFIVIIAAFVTIIQMLVKAYSPALDQALGIYLPLIVVNCIILGRAEAYASKNPVLPAVIDGAGMGVGFTAAIVVMAVIREFLGAGTLSLKLLGHGVTLSVVDAFAKIGVEPMLFFILAPGGFFVYGILMALANKLAEKKGKPKAELEENCASCPLAGSCAIKNNESEEAENK